MVPVLVGYFAKEILPRPVDFGVPHVRQLCNVSDHASDGPDGWRDLWLHNRFEAYDSIELAWSVVPPEQRARFELHAWWWYPVRFIDGRQEPLASSEVNVQPMPQDFKRLGFDAVSRTKDFQWGCSPLFCNHMAIEVLVNEYCLIDKEKDGLRTALDFSRTEPEPGPYYLIDVWGRQQQGDKTTPGADSTG